MGKQTKLREAQRRAAEQALAVRLRVHAPAKSEPAFINTYSQFAPAYRHRIEAHRDFALRAPEAWRCRLRVRSPELRFRELVRHTFAKYPVPCHLENAWLREAPGAWLGVVAEGVEGAEPADFRRWYIIVGRGGSLHREAMHRFLSKLETHHFINAPDDVDMTQRAFWYAIARAQAGDEAIALRIARTKLVGFSVASVFWRDAARFFAQNPAAIHEMNDLIDFINAAKQHDDSFSLKGRSLPALRRRMVLWHRLRREEVSGVRWCGHRRPNAEYVIGIGNERAVWRFRQIKTSGSLVQEGQQMEHCVAIYKDQCIAGMSSIWSLTCERPAGNIKKCVTIELDRFGIVVQCRGFANRLPTTDEHAVITRWAEDHGLLWHNLDEAA
jgi:hypothetical protein